MKNLLKGVGFFMLLLCFFFTKAQTITYTPMTAAGYQWKYMKIDSGLNIPNRDTSTGRGTRRGGSMVFDSTNRLFYGWDGIRWTVLGSSTTANNFVDSITVNGNNICQWKDGTPVCYTITGGGTFTGVDSLTYTGNSLCWWKAGVPTCYAMIPGVDSITVINNIFCQYKNGVATCDSITGNVLGVFVDSVTVVGTQLCQYRAGVSTCYTINSISNGVDSLTFIDSVLCSWSGGVSTCINIAGQRDTIYVKDDLTVDTTTNPGHQTIGRLRDDGFIVKPIVTWSGTGLIFNVTYGDYIINRVEYVSPPTTITLAPADLTDPRNDLFVVDTFATAKALTGIAAPVPLIPQFDEGSQLPLTSGTLINPGDTVPTGITLRIVYNENLGLPAEWLATPPPSPNVSNYNNLTNPYNGVKAIFLSKYINAAHLKFLDFSGTYIRNSVVPGDVITLAFYTNGKMNNNINLRLFDSTLSATNSLTITAAAYGFIRNDSNHYQILTVPLSAFTFLRPNYTTLDFQLIGYDTSGAKGIYIDYITIQSNLNNIPPPTDYSQKQDSNTIVKTIVGSDTLNTVYWWVKGVSHALTPIYTHSGGTGGSYQLPYDGVSTHYLGGDTVYHALPTIPTQFNPIAGTNVTITGTYPNMTFNASAPGTGTVTSISQGYGLTFSANPIVTTGSIKVDTSLLLTKLFAASIYLQNITGLVTAGTNITVTGSGTSGSPYVINSTSSGGTTSIQTQTSSSQTVTFTSVPATYADYEIFRNGVRNYPVTDYTASGDVLTGPAWDNGDIIILQRIK